VNDLLPAVTGTPNVGQVMSGLSGGWNASPPPTLADQWLHCDASGANCSPIAGATNPLYRPSSVDAGGTLRYQVTATNPSGALAQSSAPSGVVHGGVGQFGNTSTGFTSVWSTSTTELGSVFTAAPSGSVTDFKFFARGAGGAQTFTPKIYSVVNGSKATLLATGSPVNVPKGTDGRWYTVTMPATQLNAGSSYYLALLPSGTGNTYVGTEDQVKGPMSFFVDYTP
jgi:hypothetical protein